MKMFVVMCGLVLMPTMATAAVDCSAFAHQKDGSWTVTKTTRLAGIKDGVGRTAGLAPGESFARDGKTSFSGVDVLAQVEAACH